MLLGEILADDADEMDGGSEIGGGETGERGGATEQVFPFRSRSFDVVDGDGAADEDGGVGVGHAGVLTLKIQTSNFKRGEHTQGTYTRNEKNSNHE